MERLNRSAVVLGILLVGLMMISVMVMPGIAVAAPKVEVCHFPPGNPDNFHTIRISANALSVHLAHGDTNGACNAVCAQICDDGDACTIDDTDDCEQLGCPSGVASHRILRMFIPQTIVVQDHLEFVVADPFHHTCHVDPAVRTLADEVSTKIVEGQLLRGNSGWAGPFLTVPE